MKYAILTTAFILAAALNACNTVEGVGADVKAGGSKLEESAEKNKNY